EACIERLDHGDPKFVGEALAGLRHATGYDGPGSPDAVRSWWAKAREGFAADLRYVGGEPFSLTSVRSAYARGSSATREALRLELQIRSPGGPGLPSAAWPSRERAALDSLSIGDSDLTRTWK
ncbi:MAG: hypothetical protein KC457_19000, partial [Myxococcales bacterium]|nr:hypothetical protein [Myxococcales bacterium]